MRLRTLTAAPDRHSAASTSSSRPANAGWGRRKDRTLRDDTPGRLYQRHQCLHLTRHQLRLCRPLFAQRRHFRFLLALPRLDHRQSSLASPAPPWPPERPKRIRETSGGASSPYHPEVRHSRKICRTPNPLCHLRSHSKSYIVVRPYRLGARVTPNQDLVTIVDNVTLIREFLSDMVLRPRRDLMKWAAITKQTPNINIGYPAQHLASLVTGVEGARTAARGHDLCDHSEVKSCSRVDQLDKCIDCRAAVARMEVHCPVCGSSNIRRNNDSKWLLAVKSQQELSLLLDRVPRIIFILADYPNFSDEDWATIQFQVFEVWPRDPRQGNFKKLMTSYFHNIYLTHTRLDAEKDASAKEYVAVLFPILHVQSCEDTALRSQRRFGRFPHRCNGIR